MVSWPSLLPQKLHQQGFSISEKQGVIRSEVETGKPNQRLRTTAGPQEFTGRMYLNKGQYAELLKFWTNETAGGAVAFEWVHPVTQQPATIRFKADNPPSIQPIAGDLFNVSLTLEIID